jgi:hypothetical protein
VNANLLSLIPSGQPNFSVHNDSAPTVYVNGNPARTDATLRKLERDVAAAKAIDPYQSSSATPVALYLADKVGEKTLHMVTADPQADAVVHAVRQPGLLPDRREDRRRAADEVQLPGLGAPGVRLHRLPLRVEPRRRDRGHRAHLARHGRPGVKHLGITSQVWSDHTDIQPTILSLLDLRDSYQTDGGC